MKPEIYHNFQEIQPLDHVLSHINPVHNVPPYLLNIYFNIIFLMYACLPSGLIPSELQLKRV
jgi:hypothetical protein